LLSLAKRSLVALKGLASVTACCLVATLLLVAVYTAGLPSNPCREKQAVERKKRGRSKEKAHFFRS
jgi:hypothetical protein